MPKNKVIEFIVSEFLKEKIKYTLGYDVTQGELTVENEKLWETKSARIIPNLEQYCQTRVFNPEFQNAMLEIGVKSYICGSHVAFHVGTVRFAMFSLIHGNYTTL